MAPLFATSRVPHPGTPREKASKLKADATAHYRKREFEQALRLYEEGQSVNPDPSDISFLLNQAAVHFETGNIEQCIAVCQRAIEGGRDHRAPFAMLAKVRLFYPPLCIALGLNQPLLMHPGLRPHWKRVREAE